MMKSPVFNVPTRDLKIILLCLLFVTSLSWLSCSKGSAPAKNTEKPDETILIITDGASCKLINKSGRSDVSLGFPRDQNRQKTSGTVNVAVIFVDFSDAAAVQSPEAVFALMSPNSEDFISSASFGKLHVVFKPLFKWFRMSKPSGNYGWDRLTFELHQAYIQEAVNLADAEYNFSQADEILIMSNPDGGALQQGPTFMGMPGNGINADGQTISNAVTSGRDLLFFRGFWFPHEFGHSMGLSDLYSFTGPLHGYVGGFSIMGNVLGFAPNYTAWEKWLLGWFSDSQITCARGKGSGSLQLSPLVQQNGMKLLVLPINESSAVIVEDRRATGYDSGLNKEGPVVYLINTKTLTGAGVLKVLPVNPDEQSKPDAPLSIGQSVTYSNITVKCTATGSGGSTVEYERK
ncbi:MAG: M6 family metalloprotease domain-containing protein [Sphingobacteriales bacterium]|nr:MAG: M6 family metalloprotease domain-containing protein [Sphingobacteriales bacterium]